MYSTHFLEQVLVYRDDDLIVVNKPPNLLTVPGKGPELADCLITRLKQVVPETLLVHRLDRDTSGVLVFALNAGAQRMISRQFELRQISKQYVAVVTGVLKGEGSVDIPVRYEPNTPPLHVVDPDFAKKALTHWRALESFDLLDQTVTRMQLMPITGRSHQLRVHMQYIGHAIVGDGLYADALGISLSPRLCLHAEKLSLIHPSSAQDMSFEVPATF